MLDFCTRIIIQMHTSISNPEFTLCIKIDVITYSLPVLPSDLPSMSASYKLNPSVLDLAASPTSSQSSCSQAPARPWEAMYCGWWPLVGDRLEHRLLQRNETGALLN